MDLSTKYSEVIFTQLVSPTYEAYTGNMTRKYTAPLPPKHDDIPTNTMNVRIFIIVGILACITISGTSYTLGKYRGEHNVVPLTNSTDTPSTDSAQREAIHAALLIWLQQHGGAVDPLAFSLFDISGDYAAFQVAPVLPNSGAVISFGYAKNNGKTWEILDLSPEAEPADFYSNNSIPQKLQEDNPSFASDSTNGD
jgi:hypothetical protein